MSAWTCNCGRIVPPQVDRCRCGGTRPIPPPAETPGRAGGRNVLATAGKIVLAGALLFGAHRWYVSYTPPDVRGLVPSGVPPPRAVPVPSTMRVEPHGAWKPPPGLRATPAAVSGGFQFRGEGVAPEARPSQESPVSVEPARDQQRAEGPSETDLLRLKIQGYRAQYGPLKGTVDRLEREVADLGARESRFIGGGNSIGPPIEVDAVRSRLNSARNELDRARIALAAIEERARRDGVPYGQLY